MAKHIDNVVSTSREFIDKQLECLYESTPAMKFAKPFLSRAIDSKMEEYKDMLKIFTDRDGLIDIENIFTEFVDSVVNSQPTTISTKIMGDLEIGGGAIKFELPIINKMVCLNTHDMKDLLHMFVKS